MASLADSFLRDFEDEEDETDELVAETAELSQAEPPQQASRLRSVPDAVEEYKALLAAPKERTATLLDNEDFIGFVDSLQKEEERKKLVMTDEATKAATSTISLLDKCNEALQEVDREILSVHRFIKDTYSRRFPELESLVPAPLDYIVVARRLQNELNVAAVDLSDALASTAIMAVTVAASVTIGQELPASVIAKILDAAAEVDELVVCRQKIIGHVESCMFALAPNLTALAGSSLAARLVTHAGSLEALAKMPSQNILLLGGSAFARATTAFSTGANTAGTLPMAARTAGKGYGVIFHADIVQTTPPAYRVRAMKLLAGKCGLAVRKDIFNNDGSDLIGRQFREEILAALERQQKPPPPRMKKSLPAPDERPRPKRGGKRRRRHKEKYGLTELEKKKNRLTFTLNAQDDAPEEEFSD